MILEFLSHVVMLDIPWLLGFILGNLLWVFMFAAIVYYFWEGEHFLEAFILLPITMFSYAALERTIGLVMFVGGFLMIYYVSKLVILKFAEETPALRKYIVPISTLQALAAWVLYNIFIK